MSRERFSPANQNPFEQVPAWKRFVQRHKGALQSKFTWTTSGLQTLLPEVDMKNAMTWSMSLGDEVNKGKRELIVWTFAKDGSALDARAVMIEDAALPAFDKQEPKKKLEETKKSTDKVSTDEPKYDREIKPEEEGWTELQKVLKQHAGKLLTTDDWKRLPFQKNFVHRISNVPPDATWSVFLGAPQKPSTWFPYPHRQYGVVVYSAAHEVQKAAATIIEDFPLPEFPVAEPKEKRERDEELLSQGQLPQGSYAIEVNYPVSNTKRVSTDRTMVKAVAGELNTHTTQPFSKANENVLGWISMYGLHNHGLSWESYEAAKSGTEVGYSVVQVGTNRVMYKDTCRVDSNGHIVREKPKA